MPMLVVVVIVLMWISACLHVLREYERAVIFRLGRLQKPDKGPGLIFILWPIDKLVKVSLRVVAWDMPPQDIITKDNVSLKVNAVVYFRVISARKGRRRGGELLLRRLAVGADHLAHGVGQGGDGRSAFAAREAQRGASADPRLPHRTLGHQSHQRGGAERRLAPGNAARHRRPGRAERERRAKIIHADAEYQASTRLAEAAAIAKEPVAITLRYLQTLVEIGTEKNTTVVFPIPVELLSAIMGKVTPPPERSATPEEKK